MDPCLQRECLIQAEYGFNQAFKLHPQIIPMHRVIRVADHDIGIGVQVLAIRQINIEMR